MKTNTRNMIVLSAALAIGTIGCGSKERIREIEKGKTEINISATQDAETLTSAAEQLISPYTFMLADSVLDTALQKDPTNKKAQLYKLFLKQPMLTRGIAKRIRPFIKQHGNSSNLVDFDKNIAQFPESPLKKFYLDSKSEDIKTAEDVQDLFVKMRDASIDFHRFLKENQDLNLELNLNPYIFEQQIKKDSVNSCTVVDSTVICDYKDIAIRKVNSADMVALSQMAAGQVAYWTLYTSYSVKGLDKVFTTLKDGNLNARQIQNLLESQNDLGLLRKDAKFEILSKLGADFAAAWRWAIQYQSNLCPKGTASSNQRKGYVFSDGVCVSTGSQAQADLAQLEQILRGAVQMDLPANGHNNYIVKTTFDPMAVVRNPIKDLRSIAPSSYVKCGDKSIKAATLRDNTLGGIFPKGDAELMILENCKN